MNREQIILSHTDVLSMAREADREWDCDRDMVEWLEWFAALIASRVAVASASVEREACATVVEQTKWSNWFQADCAAAIRARGKTSSRWQA